MTVLSKKSLVLAAALMAVPLAQPFLASPAEAQLVQLPSFAPLIKEVGPAVVTVMVEGAVQRPGPQGGPDEREFQEFMERFRDFMPGMPNFDFRNGPQSPGQSPRQSPVQGMGSGFIIDASGIIVTNNHVVEDAAQITVALADGTQLEAQLIGRDDKIDLAVLRVETEAPLPALDWGDSDALEVGDWAVAIGNPLGLDGTVTAGIVSSLGRDIQSGPYDAYIQVDAAINRGNSGGPLFDVNGDVVGVNTAILSPSGGNIGLGFAIPAAQAQEIVEDLLDDGLVERGWIGVAIQGVSEDVAESLGLEAADGALVADVTPDSPAAAAGLQVGDVILGFADTQIETVRDLTTGVAAWDVGETASMRVWRAGQSVDVMITPGLMETSLSAPVPEAPKPPEPSRLDLAALGLSLTEAEGKVVINQASGAEAGTGVGDVQAGDIIVSINQVAVDRVDVLQAQVDAALEKGRSNVLLLIERDGNRRFVTMALNAG